jgi:hypothetical protein
MKILRLLSIIPIFLFCFTIGGISQDIPNDLKESFVVTVINPSAQARENVLVVVGSAMLSKQVRGFNSKAFVVIDNGKEIASQYNNSDPFQSGIITVLDAMKGKETRKLTIRYKKEGEMKRTYVKRTQAELSHKTDGKFVNREYIGGAFKNVNHLRVPPEHKDHSWFIRYEGPGWESDLVGYRFYLDQRNATDVFGKKTKDMVLQQVGLDGFDSYHEMQPWGMDVMKVGKSLGLGSPGVWRKNSALRIEKTDSVSCRITENGDVYSSIVTQYKGWETGKEKVDVQSVISIHAGTRLTHQKLKLSRAVDSLCTGIVKDKTAKLSNSKGDARHFAYIATFGKQSLNSDELGLAVFFDAKDVVSFTEDADSHVVILNSTRGSVQYHYLAAWVGESNGIKNEVDFNKYISNVAEELANPLKVEIKD